MVYIASRPRTKKSTDDMVYMTFGPVFETRKQAHKYFFTPDPDREYTLVEINTP